MCSAPSIEQPKQKQVSRTPVFNTKSNFPSTGRRGTILTGGDGVIEDTGSTKKQALGT